MKTMHAVVYYGKGDVRYEETALPECGAGELRVKVDACAVCGSDYKTFVNGNPRMKPPITMGHEFTGLIDVIGSGVAGFSIGDRVVMATSISCGECAYCRRGWTNLCVNLNPMGFSYPGGMADYVIVPAIAVRNGHVVKVPAGVPPQYAALAEPVSCAVNAAENCGIRAGDTVVVIGAGPLGVLNAYVARACGAKVILAQRAGKRFQQAAAFPCDRLVNTTEEDLPGIVRSLTGGIGADAVIVAAPDAAAQEQALDLARKKGHVCLFASLPVGRSTLSLDSRKIHYGELYVCGASDSTPTHVARAVEFLGRADFPGERIATPRMKMSGIAAAFATMEAREGMRVVLLP